MKEVIRFQSDNGDLFENETDALRQDDMYHTALELKGIIFPEKFDTCDFSNGGGYIQLSSDKVKIFTTRYKEAIKKFHPGTYKDAKVDLYPDGIVGRYLSDGDSPLYSVYYLLICIDKKNRLWGQPFYAINPEKGKQIELSRN